MTYNPAINQGCCAFLARKQRVGERLPRPRQALIVTLVDELESRRRLEVDARMEGMSRLHGERALSRSQSLGPLLALGFQVDDRDVANLAPEETDSKDGDHRRESASGGGERDCER